MDASELSVLFQGPVATVCRAYYAGNLVAVKVLPARLDRRTVAAFNREQAALPANAPILRPDALDQLTDGRHALRMELCAQSLTMLLGQIGTLAPADVLTLGHEMARALAAAHSVGVAHGGLTPDNVLFRASGEPVVSDFGAAVRGAFPRDLMRSIEFLPPEAVRTGTVDEHADLYALGAIMYLALTGAPPNPGRLGEPPGARVLRILDEPVPAINRPDIPVPLATLVARLLTADPAYRPRDAAMIADQLAALRTPMPDPAPAPIPDPVPIPDPAQSLAPQPAAAQPLAAQPAPAPAMAAASAPPFPEHQAAPSPDAEPALPDAEPAPPVSVLAPAPSAPEFGPATVPFPLPVPAPPPAPTSGPAPPESAPSLTPEPGPGPGPGPAYAPEPEPASEPEPALAPEPAPEPEPALAPEPAPEPEPALVPPPFDPAPAPPAPAQPEPASAQPPEFAQPPAVGAGPTSAAVPDDFAVPGESEPESDFFAESEAEPLGHRLDTKLRRPQWMDRIRREHVLGFAAIALLMIVGLVLLMPSSPTELDTSPHLPPVTQASPGTATPQQLSLAAPTDLGDHVVLTWTSSGQLDFAVIIAEQGQPDRTLLAYRNRTMTIQVDPQNKYCFLVQGTNGSQVYQSTPQPLRGAVCHL